MIYAMEVEKPGVELSNEKLETFLKTVNIPKDKKDVIIDYFKRPDTGIPICFKIENEKSSWYEKFKNILKVLEIVFFGCPLTEWKGRILHEQARLQKKHISYPLYIDTKNKKDIQATKLLQKLIEKTKLPKKINIPVFKKLPHEIFLDRTMITAWISRTDDGSLYYYITINAELYKKFKHNKNKILEFDLAHEHMHIKRGLFNPYKNMLKTKLLSALNASLCLVLL